MFRKTQDNTRYAPLAVYKHRSSVYHTASFDEVDAIIAEVRMMTGVPKEIANVDALDFALPPKQPVPNVVLRTDIMEQRRSHLAL